MVCIEVEEGDNPGRAVAPDILETVGICPCTAIGIINTKKRIGYLGHFLDAQIERKIAYRRMINAVIGETESTEDLTVRIAGRVALSREECKDYQAELRRMREDYEDILNYLTSKKIKQDQIDNRSVMNKPSPYFFNMKVIPEKGQILVQKERRS